MRGLLYFGLMMFLALVCRRSAAFSAGRIIVPGDLWRPSTLLRRWSNNHCYWNAAPKQCHGPRPRADCRCFSSSTKPQEGLGVAAPATAGLDLSSSPDGASRNHQPDDRIAYQELKSIATQLFRHDDLYYNSATTSNNNDATAATITPISDDEYDALAAREAELCQQHPLLWQRWKDESGLGERATRYQGRVGIATTTAISSQRPKQTHLVPMLSLDNVHDTAQLLAWLERVRQKMIRGNTAATTTTEVPILTEPKLDGVSLSLRYERSNSNNNNTEYALQWACTRGDGRRGTDVTQAVRDMKSLPEQINCWTTYNTDTAAVGLPDCLEVRGEVVLPTSVFQKLRDEAVDDSGDGSSTILATFANARNAASGILQRYKEQQNATDSETDTEHSPITESQELRSKLRFYAYQVVHDGNNPLFENALETRRILEEQGFSTPHPVISSTLILPANDSEALSEKDIPNNMLEYYEILREFRINGTTHKDYQWGDFDVDGCVHKLVHESHRQLLGNSNRFPRWAVAHKFPPTAVVTDLLGMEVQVGRTGALTPVAILKPVDVAGVTVQRATLHNFPHMRQVLGDVDRVRKGCSVVVRRAGDVIPQVVSRLVVEDAIDGEQVGSLDNTDSSDTTSDEFISLSTPTHCPACGSVASFDDANATARHEPSVGQVLRCQGPPLLCPPRAVGAIRHAVSRDTLEIKGLSEKRIEQLMEAGFLKKPSDLFSLAKDRAKLEELAKLEGWGKKSVQNLEAEAKRVARDGVSLSRFIQSLGIRLVGNNASPLLAAAYGSVGAFVEDLEKAVDFDNGSPKADRPPFSRLEGDSDLNKGIGPVMLASLWEFASQKEMVDAARELAGSIRVIDDTSNADVSPSTDRDVSDALQTPLSGLSVVFAGKIPGLTQAKAKLLAKQMGATATPATISKSTGCVVSTKNGGKKREQAEQLGIRVIEADEFLKMLDDFDVEVPETEPAQAPKEPDAVVPMSPLSGLSVVFTGSVPGYSRQELRKLAKEMGAKSTPGSISKSTGLLVLGEKGGSKKIEQAENLEVHTVSTDEFLNMVDEFRAKAGQR